MARACAQNGVCLQPLAGHGRGRVDPTTRARRAGSCTRAGPHRRWRATRPGCARQAAATARRPTAGGSSARSSAAGRRRPGSRSPRRSWPTTCGGPPRSAYACRPARAGPGPGPHVGTARLGRVRPRRARRCADRGPGRRPRPRPRPRVTGCGPVRPGRRRRPRPRPNVGSGARGHPRSGRGSGRQGWRGRNRTRRSRPVHHTHNRARAPASGHRAPRRRARSPGDVGRMARSYGWRQDGSVQGCCGVGRCGGRGGCLLYTSPSPRD